MARTFLTSEAVDDGFIFYLQRSRVLGGNENISVTDWVSLASSTSLSGASILLALVEREEAKVVTAQSILVPHAKIAALDGQLAAAIVLPRPVPHQLDLQHSGTLDQKEFHFRLSWIKLGGQPVLAAQRQGAALRVSGQIYRIPEPLFTIIEAAEAFNAAPPEDIGGRFHAFAKMRPHLPEEAERSIRASGYLISTRIAHASMFSLRLHSGADGFKFDPILLGSGESTVGQLIDEAGQTKEFQSLLPSAQHDKFANQRFPESTECKAHYALGQGWYVVLDEPVRKALTVVRHAQMGDAESRRQFARNPRSFLAAALGATLTGESIERLFVETTEYSERVHDVGLWQPKVLPWIKKSTECWLPPETLGLRIGGEYMTLQPKAIAALREAVDRAIAAGNPTVTWDGKTIPASAETMASLNALEGEVTPQPQVADGVVPSPEPPEPLPEGRIVLQIASNLAENDYIRVRGPERVGHLSRAPACLKTHLKPHQFEGVGWLQTAWRAGEVGVLLADDMGLGKTLQTLTFLAWVREEMDAGHIKTAPLLVVAPTGLLANWQEEHEKHLREPGLGEPLCAFGARLSALKIGRGSEIEIGRPTLDQERLINAKWILITYETLRDYQHSFGAIRFAVAVFDEMQKVKTPGALMTEAVKALNAGFLVGLTGTPIENRLADLWCLIDTLQPGLLKDLATFSRTYERDERQEELSKLKSCLMEPFNSRPQIMLRRMKADRLEGLPDKIEHALPAKMSEVQASTYDEAICQARADAGKGRMLEALQKFRSISLHPEHPCNAKGDVEIVAMSARFRVMFKELDRIADAKEKALIFLESQEMQPYLAAILQRRYALKHYR